MEGWRVLNASLALEDGETLESLITQMRTVPPASDFALSLLAATPKRARRAEAAILSDRPTDRPIELLGSPTPLTFRNRNILIRFFVEGRSCDTSS